MEHLFSYILWHFLLPEGHETIKLEAGKSITLRTSEDWADAGSTEVSKALKYEQIPKTNMECHIMHYAYNFDFHDLSL